jgi:hypothetical protein
MYNQSGGVEDTVDVQLTNDPPTADYTLRGVPDEIDVVGKSRDDQTARFEVTVENVGDGSGRFEINSADGTNFHSNDGIPPGESEQIKVPFWDGIHLEYPDAAGEKPVQLRLVNKSGVDNVADTAEVVFTNSNPAVNFQIVDIRAPDVIDPEEYPAAFDV